MKIKNYAPSVNPGQLQVLETKAIKAEQGEIKGLSKNLTSASKNLPGASKYLPSKFVESINPPLYPPPQWGTTIVYDETGRTQLMGVRVVNLMTNRR